MEAALLSLDRKLVDFIWRHIDKCDQERKKSSGRHPQKDYKLVEKLEARVKELETNRSIG